MANLLAKDLELMFEPLIGSYDAACVLSQAAKTSYPDPQKMQRANDVVYKKQDYQAAIVTGLDVSAATRTDVIERFVPTVFRSPDNVIFELNAYELRDKAHMQNMGEAAAAQLAGEVDKNLGAIAAAQAAIVVKKVGALDIQDAFQARALMASRGINGGDRKIFFSPFDAIPIYNALATKSTMGDWSKSAYERAMMPGVSSFQAFETDSVVNVAAVGTVTGTTVTANTSHTVTAMTGDLPTDNRYGTLGVSGANIANIKNGDSFTIPGVNAVHNITKQDSGKPMTFRVISGGGTASLTISPKIVVSGPYQNVTAQAAAGAAITFLNTATAPANVFWEQGAVTLDYGKLEFPSGTGAQVMTSTTKNGVPIVMVAQMNAQTGKVFVRATTLYAATVLQPERCGIILANQT